MPLSSAVGLTNQSMRIPIWDFDGTLAERRGLWSQCLADVANAYTCRTSYVREQFIPQLQTGFPWHSPQLAHLKIETADAWWSTMNSVFETAFRVGGGFTVAESVALAQMVRAEYTNPQQWHVFPDTDPTLSQMARLGWRHIILSNHVPELPTLIESLGLAKYFDSITTSAISGYEKPHPLAFLNALPPRVSVQDAVMIGDNFEADVNGAEAVGIRAFLVRKPDPRRGGAVNQLGRIVAALGEA
jgi:putative hydrolase of the HAD superfamily